MTFSDEEKTNLFWEIERAIENIEADDRRYNHMPNGIVEKDYSAICLVLKRHGLCKYDRSTD